jgi:DNA-binding IclR family transcriptional regulator
VDNALRLLQLIGQRNAIRVAGAADELGVARSTAHRLLTTLKSRGFVTQDKPNGAYRLGPVLHEIALASIGRMDIRRTAVAVLETLRTSTRETASLLFLEGNQVRFIDCLESPRSVRVGSRTGLVLPAHCTAGGKAILAALPEADLYRRYPDRQLEVRTPDSIADWAALERERARIRECGFAINIGEGETGISAVGVALHDVIGVPLAAVAVAVPTSRMATVADGEALAPMLASARSAIIALLRPELSG